MAFLKFSINITIIIIFILYIHIFYLIDKYVILKMYTFYLMYVKCFLFLFKKKILKKKKKKNKTKIKINK